MTIETLVTGYNGSLPELDMTPLTIGMLVLVIAIKLALLPICARAAVTSPSADALAQDYRRRTKRAQRWYTVASIAGGRTS
jgi:hypothetical protein